MSNIKEDICSSGDILIVEDDVFSLKFLSDILKKAGYHVRPASDGDLALRSVKAKLPDLILMDIKLPGFSGIEISHSLKSDPKTCDIPIIFISALDERDLKVKAFKSGGVDYITKPFESLELLARINTHLNQKRLNWKLQNQAEELRVEIKERMILESKIKVFQKFAHFAEQGMSISTLNMKFHYSNPKFNEFVGENDSDNVIGTSCLRFYPESIQKRFDNEIIPTVMTKGHWEGELEIVTVTGEKRPTLETIFLIYDDEQNPLYLANIVTDIRNLKNIEERIIELQRLEAIGFLAGGVAHEFNNLVMEIKAYSSFLLEKVHPDDPIYEDIKEIMNAGDRVASITRHLLSFGRKQVIQPAVINLNDQITSIHELLMNMVGENITLLIELDADLPLINMDSRQIEQIILHLVDNAHSAMPEGGEMVIKTENVVISKANPSQHRDIDPGSYVLLKVCDTGCGIAEDILGRIFEPFFTTRDIGNGAGLGLSAVYGIVKQNKGSIMVFSKPGEGAAFHIYFPAMNIYREIQRDPPNEDDLYHGSETILMVDDDEIIRKIITRGLTDYGYTVLAAENGGDALRIINEYENVIPIAFKFGAKTKIHMLVI